MPIDFYHYLNDVHKVSCKSVKGNRSYEGDKQTEMTIYDIDMHANFALFQDPTTEKYNSFGKDIKRISRVSSQNSASTSTASALTAALSASQPSQSSQPTNAKLGWNAIQGSEINLSDPSSVKKLPKNMMIEKHTKIRIANPTITQVQLDLSLLGRKLIPLSKLRQSIVLKETDSDWTTIGVIYYKECKKSKNGNTFTIWKMTDLLGDIQTVTILLFGKANTKHYSMPTNKVVGLLNPKVLEDRAGKGKQTFKSSFMRKIDVSVFPSNESKQSSHIIILRII